MNAAQKTFLEHSGAKLPLICGAMYPCSNPELVGAAARAGAMAVVQPLSLVFAHGWRFEEGLDHIRSITENPVGLNVMSEGNNQVFIDRNKKWIRAALDRGVRFFVTSLGDPSWIVDEVKSREADAVVYHDVVGRRHAEKAVHGGVDGLICVNRRAGGHTGHNGARRLYDELADLGVPLVCAGGIASEDEYTDALTIGYASCQLGTRFIATEECTAHDSYKQAIVNASEGDIVLTEKISGVPVSVINTDYVKRVGTSVGPLQKLLLQNNHTKHYMRMFYSAVSALSLKDVNKKGGGYQNYFLAGKSVAHIDSVQPVQTVVDNYFDAWQKSIEQAGNTQSETEAGGVPS